MSTTKKWTLGIAISAVALLLVYRLFTKRFDGEKTEKDWFLSQLNYEFSAEIDTVNRANHILFHVIHGHLDKSQEEELI